MKKFRLIGGVLVIIAALAGIYFSFKNSIPNIDLANKSKEGKTSLNNNVAQNNSDNAIFSGQGQSLGNLSTFNMTQALGNTFFNRINSQDAVDKIKTDSSRGIIPLSGQITSDLLTKSQTDLNFITELSDFEIKITSDTSKTAKEKYLKEIGETIKKDFSNYNVIYLQVIVDTYQKLDSSSATKSAEVYRNLANDFFKIAVPVDWADVHKEIIMYYKNSEVVYRAMANYQTDPIKGYLALDMIDSLVKQAPLIQDKLAGKAKEIQ